MSLPQPVFELSPRLERQVQEAFGADSPEQSGPGKLRFRPGAADDDFDGFYTDDRPFTDSMKKAARNLLGATGDTATWDAIDAADATPQLTDPQLNYLAGQVHAAFHESWKGKPHLRQWVQSLAHAESLPRVFLDAPRPGRPRQTQRVSALVFKTGAETQEQWDYYDRIRKQNAPLASYFVPMAACRLQSNVYALVMPYLSYFVTLSDLLCTLAGIGDTDRFAYVQKDEVDEVFGEIVRQLAEIVTMSRGPSPLAQTPRERVVNRIKNRFNSNIPIVLGEKLYGSLAEFAMNTVIERATTLLHDTQASEMAFPHGDLNATNVMVHIERDSRQRIRQVLVRMIDPNPGGSIGDEVFELSRLLHWLELGLPLRLGQAQGRPAFTINFRGRNEANFLDHPELVRIRPSDFDDLSDYYQRFLKLFFAAFPQLERGLGWQKLSLGVALYHLIATKHWHRNVDRTVAFFAAIDELGYGSPDSFWNGRIGQCEGLWAVRRQNDRR